MFERRDNTLVKKALKGDQSAWLSLIDRYEKAIFNYGIRMVGNPADAADLMQDIFLSVYKSLDSFRGDKQGSFKCWLFRIAHFRCVEWYRKRHLTVPLEEAPEQACPQVQPEDQSLMACTQSQLHTAMQTLPLEQKAVVELKFFGQFTFEEIAEQLGTSANTAKSRLYAALNKLRISLEVDHV